MSERVRGAARVPVRVSDSESPGSQLVKYGKKSRFGLLTTHPHRAGGATFYFHAIDTNFIDVQDREVDLCP